MFLRIRGRRAYLLHNYRDGQSRVRQRCLFRTDLRELADWCSNRGWATIQERMRRCPEIAVDWDRLRCQLLQALELMQGRQPPSSRPRRRTTYDPTEPEVRQFLVEWASSSERLRSQGNWDELCYQHQLRQRKCPSPEGARALAESLQRCGKYREAVALWSTLPRSSVERYFNSAAAHLRMQDLAAATDQLLRGLNRNEQIAHALRRGDLDWGYWKRHSGLWDQASGLVLLHLMRDRAVLYKLFGLRDSQCRVRKWRGTWWFGMVLGRLRPRIASWGLREIHLSLRWQVVKPVVPTARRAGLAAMSKAVACRQAKT